MMRRIGIILVFMVVLVGAPAQAQDDDPYAIALERIEAVHESGATQLNLNRLGLTQLPPEVFNLTDLQVLYFLWQYPTKKRRINIRRFV